MPYALCPRRPMPYALCPMPYAVRVPHLSEKGYTSSLTFPPCPFIVVAISHPDFFYIFRCVCISVVVRSTLEANQLPIERLWKHTRKDLK